MDKMTTRFTRNFLDISFRGKDFVKVRDFNSFNPKELIGKTLAESIWNNLTVNKVYLLINEPNIYNEGMGLFKYYKWLWKGDMNLENPITNWNKISNKSIYQMWEEEKK